MRRIFLGRYGLAPILFVGIAYSSPAGATDYACYSYDVQFGTRGGHLPCTEASVCFSDNATGCFGLGLQCVPDGLNPTYTAILEDDGLCWCRFSCEPDPPPDCSDYYYCDYDNGSYIGCDCGGCWATGVSCGSCTPSHCTDDCYDDCNEYDESCCSSEGGCTPAYCPEDCYDDCGDYNVYCCSDSCVPTSCAGNCYDDCGEYTDFCCTSCQPSYCIDYCVDNCGWNDELCCVG